jgi:hypothetical protein
MAERDSVTGRVFAVMSTPPGSVIWASTPYVPGSSKAEVAAGMNKSQPADIDGDASRAVTVIFVPSIFPEK